MKMLRKLSAVLLFAALTLAVLAAALNWTPINYQTIFGLQGRYLLPILPLALLTGCARTPDMTPVWQETLPGSGAKATLSNCTLQDEREVDYIYSREDQDWKTRPALFTTASPVLTLTGVTADQVELRFSEEIADLYLGYDRVMPQPKLDYIFTETEIGRAHV